MQSRLKKLEASVEPANSACLEILAFVHILDNSMRKKVKNKVSHSEEIWISKLWNNSYTQLQGTKKDDRPSVYKREHRHTILIQMHKVEEDEH